MSNDFNKFLKDVEKQAVKAASDDIKKNGIKLDCPHCGKEIKVKGKKITCPHCKNKINLDVNF